MKHGRTLLAMALLASIFSPLFAAPTINVPAGIDPIPWDALLKKYVNDDGLVAYEKWKSNAADMKVLDEFLKRYGATAGKQAQGAEEIAALINAYNAPEKNRAALERGDMKIDYVEYDWGLNDQGGRGKNYHRGFFERLIRNAK